MSAPRATISGSVVDNTGAIYECQVNPVTGGRCSGLVGDGNGADLRLYDMQGEQAFFFVDQGKMYAALTANIVYAQ